MDDLQRERLYKLSTTNVADALDFYHSAGATIGIRPICEVRKKIVGEAVTLRMIPAGKSTSGTHLGVKAIESARPGDIIVIDNGGRLDISCWGGVLATGASLKGLSGVVIDGACRDIDDYVDLDFPVYARGSVVATARGRAMEEATNILIQFGGVQVRPGDIIIADRSGVAVIPSEIFPEVLDKAEELYAKEESMCADLRSGLTSLEVDTKYSYNAQLN